MVANLTPERGPIQSSVDRSTHWPSTILLAKGIPVAASGLYPADAREQDQLSAARRCQDCPSPGIAAAVPPLRISRSRAASQALRGDRETSPTACWRSDLHRIELTIRPIATAVAFAQERQPWARCCDEVESGPPRLPLRAASGSRAEPSIRLLDSRGTPPLASAESSRSGTTTDPRAGSRSGRISHRR